MAYFLTAAGTAVVGSLIGADASRSAANKQAGAARDAAQLSAETTEKSMAQQQEMYNQNVARLNPYVEAGKGSLAQLVSGSAPGGQFMQRFDGSTFEQDPSYKWRLEQGLRALQGSAAAKGTLMTGQGAADITNYAQGAASQEYQNAYNRFQDQNNTLFNRLNTMAGNSQNAAAGLGAQGTQVSSSLANTAMTGAQNQAGYMIGAGNAQAAGSIGAANAVTNSIGQGLNMWQSQQYLNTLNKQPTYSGGGGGSAAPTWAGPDSGGATPIGEFIG